MHRLLGMLALLCICRESLVLCQEPEVRPKSIADAGSREFEFHYDFQVNGLSPGEQIRVWMPLPLQSKWQSVKVIRRSHLFDRKRDVQYGNTWLYGAFQVPVQGSLEFENTYRILRKEVRLQDLDLPEQADSAVAGKEFLAPNRLVPVQGKPKDRLLASVKLPLESMARAKVLYDLVNDHVRYSKDGVGWGKGDAEWVCDSRYGNCTDFHSLFISLARSSALPAKFEIGFPIPSGATAGKIAGYHCWAWFWDSQKGWVPVDISEADKHPELADYYFGSLTKDRVAFSVGRDHTLEPAQEGPPLNYFVYPYIEVDGRPLSRDQVTLDFHFSEK